MNNCKNCKHFAVPKFPIEPNGWGWCALFAAAPDSLAIAEDRGGDPAAVKVSHEFGCVQWQHQAAH